MKDKVIGEISEQIQNIHTEGLSLDLKPFDSDSNGSSLSLNYEYGKSWKEPIDQLNEI